jgi:hypothetical protein
LYGFGVPHPVHYPTPEKGDSIVSETHTVIVCMPAGEPIDWFSASEVLDWHHQPAGTPLPFFPVRRRGRLDLTAAAVAANAEASARWRTWAQVVRDTPPARPRAEFLADHTAEAKKLSMEEAVRRFEAQPRVLAILAYNAHPVARHRLDPYELEAYQAGEATYGGALAVRHRRRHADHRRRSAP